MPVRPNALRISSKLARMQTARFTTIIVVNQQVKYDLDQVINCRGKGDTAWFETLLNTVSEKRVTVRDIPRVVKLIRSNTGLSFNARTCFNGLPSLDQHCTERYISSDPFFSFTIVSRLYEIRIFSLRTYCPADFRTPQTLIFPTVLRYENKTKRL